MAEITTLAHAVSQVMQHGQQVAMEGFTHLIPYAAGHEVMRQGWKNLHLVRMTPDILYDQMIGIGAADELTFSWGGNPGVGSLHRFREAVQADWPHPLKLHEHSHADMAARYQAGASGLPVAIIRGYVGSDLPKHNPDIRFFDCPFTGETLALSPALNPDVAILHAQKADRKGNVLVSGIIGVQKEAAMASRRVIVTVEEIVDDLAAPMNSCMLPHWILDFVCEVPGGAHPSYAHGYYARDNAFCKQWDTIAKDRTAFTRWVERHILSTSDFAEYRLSLASATSEVPHA